MSVWVRDRNADEISRTRLLLEIKARESCSSTAALDSFHVPDSGTTFPRRLFLLADSGPVGFALQSEICDRTPHRNRLARYQGTLVRMLAFKWKVSPNRRSTWP